ncbi:hypothetical protein D3C72_1902300 [compost metagenome]
MATPNTQHPDRQSSQPQMPAKEGEKRKANTSSSPNPREAQRGRDVQEPRKREDDIERYASEEDEDVDMRDVTDEDESLSDTKRHASDSSFDKSQKGQQRSSSSSERGTASSERSSIRNEGISSERSTDRSSSSERKSSDKRH